MNTLIINTAFENANYVLIKNEKTFDISTPSSAKHSETSLVKIDELLNDANLNISEIDCICVNLGPGSFTGIRIGVAITKGIACALNKIKLIGFESFEPIANANRNTEYVCIKASNDDYYVAKCKNGEIIGHQILTNNDVDNLENAIIFNQEYSSLDLINLANKKIQNEEFSNINECNPVYLKLSQAEQELLKKETK